MSNIEKEDSGGKASPNSVALQECHCSVSHKTNRKSIKANVRCKEPHPQSESEQEINNSSQSNNQASETIGYCFDEVIGLAKLLGIEATRQDQAIRARAKLVELALAQSSNREFRALLAPEIRHAAALTVECMNFGIESLEAGVLPREMCTKELQELVNLFFGAPNDTRVMEAVTLCNDALGRCEGERLHLDDLRVFFQNPENCNTYPDSYKQLMEVWEDVVEPADIAFDEYCLLETTYRQYIESYYGKGGWFAFQREFTNERSTSMIDITAKLLGLTLIIYDTKNKIYYYTECHGSNEILIMYNGVDHFSEFTEHLLVPHPSADKLTV